jgi:integrase
MTILNLNRKTIAALPDGEGYYWDTELRGFGYIQRTDASGVLRKSFVLQYRFGNKQRKIKIADANQLNAEQARKQAEKFWAMIKLGTDPQAKKEAERIEAAKLTFEQAVKQYLEAKKTELRPSSFKSAELYLTGAAYFPTLHRKPVDAITRGDIAPHIDRIARKRVATASRCRAHLNSFFIWCLQHEHLSHDNPVAQTPKPKADASRKLVLSDDELKAVWKACGDDDYGKIVKLLILTGCRREEIGGLQWSEFNDFDAGVVTIPGVRTKNKQPLTLALPWRWKSFARFNASMGRTTYSVREGKASQCGRIANRRSMMCAA